jgi:hypothetical protein
MYYGTTGKLPNGLDDESADGPVLKDDPNAPFRDDE